MSTSSQEGELEEEENLMRSGMRTPVRGAAITGVLETVEESSGPTTPMDEGEEKQTGALSAVSDHVKSADDNATEDGQTKKGKPLMESGSESGDKGTGKSGRNPPALSSTKPPTISTRKSYTQLALVKTKTGGEGTVKNMTVETETVSSVPQVAVGGGTGERGAPGRADPGSLRLKPSNETIRPRKEKKRNVRKAPSLNSGTGRLWMHSISKFNVHLQNRLHRSMKNFFAIML